MTLNFFCDVDGTLLPFGKGLPESAVRAVREAQSRGHRFFLSTGRSEAEIDPRLSEISFDGGVYSNGAKVVFRDRIIFERKMTAEDISFLIDYSGKKDFLFMIQTDSGTYLTAEAKEFFISSMRKSFGKPIDVPNLIVYDKFPKDLPGVDKFLFLSPGHMMGDAHTELSGRYEIVNNTVGLPQSDMAEICMTNLSKGTGVAEMMKALGEDISFSVAVGDGANDVEMLETAGLGIAMGNAPDDVKSRADWVTADVSNDGFMKAVEYAEKHFC